MCHPTQSPCIRPVAHRLAAPRYGSSDSLLLLLLLLLLLQQLQQQLLLLLECLRNPKIVDLSTGRESTTRPKVPYFVPERDQ